jgi:hypothetical protein
LLDAHAVETASVAAYPEGLPGARRTGVLAGCDAQGPAFDAPVSPVVVDVGAVSEMGVGARQQRVGGLVAERLVSFQNK